PAEATTARHGCRTDLPLLKATPEVARSSGPGVPTPPPARPADGPMPPVRRGDGPGLRRSLEHARRAPLVQRLRDAPAVRHDRRGDRPQRRIEDGVALRRPLREMPTHLGVVLRT